MDKIYHTPITTKSVCKNGSLKLGVKASCKFSTDLYKKMIEAEQHGLNHEDAKEKLLRFLKSDECELIDISTFPNIEFKQLEGDYKMDHSFHVKKIKMKRKVTNTEAEHDKEDVLSNFPFINPNTIYRQEAQGQKELVGYLQLPRKINGKGDTKIIFKKLGIKILNTDDTSDDLFWNVRLPVAWKIEATEHDMWNKLLDDKGRTRMSIFYKASFHDRKAFVNLECRYRLVTDHHDRSLDEGSYVEKWVKQENTGSVYANPRGDIGGYIQVKKKVWVPKYSREEQVRKSSFYFDVLDQDKVIYTSEPHKIIVENYLDEQVTDFEYIYQAARETNKQLANGFMDERYPGWHNPIAYWNQP